jgi:hypothetical protein
MQRLSDYIRAGTSFGKQRKMIYVAPDGSCCALGAAVQSAGAYNDTETCVYSLIRLFPELETYVTIPEDARAAAIGVDPIIAKSVGLQMDMFNAINRMNFYMTRERIADWLDTLNLPDHPELPAPLRKEPKVVEGDASEEFKRYIQSRVLATVMAETVVGLRDVEFVNVVQSQRPVEPTYRTVGYRRSWVDDGVAANEWYELPPVVHANFNAPQSRAFADYPWEQSWDHSYSSRPAPVTWDLVALPSEVANYRRVFDYFNDVPKAPNPLPRNAHIAARPVIPQGGEGLRYQDYIRRGMEFGFQLRGSYWDVAANSCANGAAALALGFAGDGAFSRYAQPKMFEWFPELLNSVSVPDDPRLALMDKRPRPLYSVINSINYTFSREETCAWLDTLDLPRHPELPAPVTSPLLKEPDCYTPVEDEPPCPSSARPEVLNNAVQAALRWAVVRPTYEEEELVYA